MNMGSLPSPRQVPVLQKNSEPTSVSLIYKLNMYCFLFFFQTSNGQPTKEPKVIEVQGLHADSSDTGVRYIAKMGNVDSIEQKQHSQGQLDPLTDAKNSKTRKDIEEADDGAIEEGANTEKLSSADQNADSNTNENNNKAKDTGARGDDDIVVNKDGSYEIDGRKKDDDVEIMIASKDDVDAASTYSLFMEKDFRYYFQHPYSRLLIAYFVVFCNFLIYAEDPVAHSRKECLIPMIGNDVAFICTRYPPNAWSLLKVVFWLTGTIVGMFVGKLLIHGLLFSKYKMYAFTLFHFKRSNLES